MRLSDFAGKGGRSVLLKRVAGGRPKRYTFVTALGDNILLYDAETGNTLMESPSDFEPVAAHSTEELKFPALVAKLAHAAGMDLFDGDEDGVERKYWEAWDYQLVKFAQLLLEAHGVEACATMDGSSAPTQANDDQS